jgi:uncharacterized protein (DUF2141 family)
MATIAHVQSASAFGITVHATGFRNADGQAIVALYRSASDWLKVGQAHRVATVPIGNGAVDVRFDGLDAGTYAVSVIHDENRNGKLDMRWFPWPKPKEGAGVSNDARGGPPRWRDAKLELDRDANIQVSLTY